MKTKTISEDTMSSTVGEMESFNFRLTLSFLNGVPKDIPGIKTKLQEVSDIIHDAIIRYENDPRTVEEELEELYQLRAFCGRLQFQASRVN